MSKYGIQKGWMGKIHIGRLNKAQTLFLDDKEDHTMSAVNAVLEYVISEHEGEMEFTTPKKRYTVSVQVEDLNERNKNE